MSRSRINRCRQRREELKIDTEARKEVWQAMSPQDQMNSLDYRLGKGVGAVRQRARILAKLGKTEEPEKKAAPKKKRAKKSKKTD